MEANEHILEEIRLRLLMSAERMQVKIRALYVFGSFGTPAFRSESDIDLGVLGTRPFTAEEVMDMIKTLDLPAGHVVDFVDLLAVDLEMQDIVISERRRFYTDPECIESVEDFEHYVWVMYLTLCDDRKEIIDQIRKTGVIYGPHYIEKGRIRKPVYKTRTI
jgi:predicted nucleotidyltransferase